MEKDRWGEGLLEYLKEKEKISELEKDILSTIQTYKKIPFDRAEAERKIIFLQLSVYCQEVAVNHLIA